MQEKAFMIVMTNQRPLNQEVILAHVNHLKALDHQKRLVFCGPYVNKPGGIVIIYANDIVEAEKLAKQDPFIAQGFKTYEIIEVEEAHKDNHYLI
ncbi:MAG: YciI family protein [Acholeplasmataceae bacterium]|jgi:uncharacterized protein YciI|nr:YciI family protein [Acholeplasmataceae bacterium]